jgi:UDP-N-acetylglucosamine--N-acetylmuramyl-(pentapeptide) pyrophosphoryl-undecaprenol N-acetylglucosamine transferase
LSEPLTIFLAGGGTGGHLYPGIAVAESLRKTHPDCRAIFLCTQKEIDRVILEAAGFEFIPQPIVPPVKTVGGLLKFWRSWRETKDLVAQQIAERRPAAILGLGGYAAGVAVKVAAIKKIPSALINPDVIPGKANKYLVGYAQHICCQFEQTAAHLASAQRSKVNVTGCPIRSDIINLPKRAEAAARLGLNARLSTLAITGASLGAQTINEAVLAMLKDVKLQGWQILHLAGREHALKVREGYRELEIDARVIDFTPAMADVWAVADLAICRAGASSCAELTACGVASILMPYPYHKDMHQRANAKVLADSGAAVLVDDEKDAKKNATKLHAALMPLLYDQPKRTAMGEAAKKLGRPDAANAVAAIVIQMSENRRREE